MKQCSCCENKAKYEVEEVPVCGKHLTYMVDRHCEMPPFEAKVRKLKRSTRYERSV